MNDPKNKATNPRSVEPLSGSNEDLDDTGTTMRLQTLKLEGELWPEEEAIDSAADDGIDPYNTVRFDSKKLSRD